VQGGLSIAKNPSGEATINVFKNAGDDVTIERHHKYAPQAATAIMANPAATIS
jgi:hypothetical protein